MAIFRQLPRSQLMAFPRREADAIHQSEYEAVNGHGEFPILRRSPTVVSSNSAHNRR
jgi:hypothetical protein